MQTIETIKKMSKGGMSIREIHKKTGFSRNTISKYLDGGQVGYHRKKEHESPRKDEIRPVITSWLEEDETAPRKQKRTRMKMFKDLVDHHDYDGSYGTVKEVFNEIKGKRLECFVPRHHEPGKYGEFDFGELYIDIAGKREKMYLHAYQLPCSNRRFGYISQRASQEEMFESHKRAFEHFEGVVGVMRYDNLKQAVKRIIRRFIREENPSFRRFRELFGFEAEFCDVGKGNQKGDVEGGVGYFRRNFFSPVIKLCDMSELEDLNTKLAKWCCEDAEKVIVPDTGLSSAELFTKEKSTLLCLPSQVDVVGVCTTAKANHYSMICVRQNHYSVPVRYAHQHLDVLIGAREIVVFAKNKTIAQHRRCFEKGKHLYDATHYIELFKQKPYALVNGKPIAQLPEEFGTFFARAYHKGCIKHCVDVLELLKRYDTNEVAGAIELAMAYDTYSADGVQNLLHQLHCDQPIIQKLSTFKRPDLATIRIPAVDLSRYNRLCKESADV